MIIIQRMIISYTNSSLLGEYYYNINNTQFINNHLIYIRDELIDYFYNDLNIYPYNRKE